MSAWGVGPFENDDGADLAGLWDDYIAESAPAWGMDKTGKFFEDMYFSGELPAVGDGNAKSIIALGAKFHEAFGSIPNKIMSIVALALAWEAKSDVSVEWENDSEKRKKELLNLAEQFRVEVAWARPIKQHSRYSKEIAEFKVWFANLDRINAVRECMAVNELDFVDSIKPEFGRELEANTWDLSDNDDEDGAAELGNLRFLYIVWFVLFNLKYEASEIKAVIERDWL